MEAEFILFYFRASLLYVRGYFLTIDPKLYISKSCIGLQVLLYEFLGVTIDSIRLGKNKPTPELSKKQKRGQERQEKSEVGHVCSLLGNCRTT